MRGGHVVEVARPDEVVRAGERLARQRQRAPHPRHRRRRDRGAAVQLVLRRGEHHDRLLVEPGQRRVAGHRRGRRRQRRQVAAPAGREARQRGGEARAQRGGGAPRRARPPPAEPDRERHRPVPDAVEPRQRALDHVAALARVPAASGRRRAAAAATGRCACRRSRSSRAAAAASRPRRARRVAVPREQPPAAHGRRGRRRRRRPGPGRRARRAGACGRRASRAARPPARPAAPGSVIHVLVSRQPGAETTWRKPSAPGSGVDPRLHAARDRLGVGRVAGRGLALERPPVADRELQPAVGGRGEIGEVDLAQRRLAQRRVRVPAALMGGEEAVLVGGRPRVAVAGRARRGRLRGGGGDEHERGAQRREDGDA